MLENTEKTLDKSEALPALQVFGKMISSCNVPHSNGNHVSVGPNLDKVKSEVPCKAPMQKRFTKLLEKQIKTNKQSKESNPIKASNSCSSSALQPLNQLLESRKKSCKEAATQDNLLEAPIFPDDYLK